MTDISKRKLTENDKLVVRNIKQYGCHVVSVFDPNGRLPFFSYSIGIQDSSGAPDVIVIGPRPELGGFLVNEYNRRVQKGKRFKRGTKYSGFLRGFSVYFEPALREKYRRYTYGCARYYDGREYSVVQLVWPSTTGVWPWNKSASKWLIRNQPMLGRVRPDRP
jgi:hypothetical protein